MSVNSLLAGLRGEPSGEFGQRQQEVLLGRDGQLGRPQQLLVYIDDILFRRSREFVWGIKYILQLLDLGMSIFFNILK